MIKFHAGDWVRLKADPRHYGRVFAVIRGRVRVKWEETNWVSDEDPRDLTGDENGSAKNQSN